MKNKIIKLKFFSDPGHGWLEVPLNLIKELDIGSNISSYSYMNLKKVYLEEDCDAPFFLNKIKELGFKSSTITSVTNNPSFIRSLYPFSKEKIDFCLSLEINKTEFNIADNNKIIRAKIVSEDNLNYFVDSADKFYKIKKKDFLFYASPIEVQQKIKKITSNNIEFNMRIVENGENYGLNNKLIHNKEEPLVEFYDTRFDITSLGQFVTRYGYNTLLESKNNGLDLCGGNNDWKLNNKEFKEVQDFLKKQSQFYENNIEKNKDSIKLYKI